MCGVKDILEPPKLNFGQAKRETTDLRKEKSRDAARCRRAKESDYFQELEELIPVHGTPPHSQMTSIDKTSLIRLTVSYLKTRDLVSSTAGISVPEIKEENEFGNIDMLTALNGFGLVLNHEQDIVYVTNNVSEFIGLTSFELLGMPLAEFVHPCDHTIVRNMFSVDKDNEGQDTHVKACIRIKCTITDRGRLINLKQANYKALKLEGKIRVMPKREEGGLQGPLFIGVASLVSNPLNLGFKGAGVFETKHSQDFKIVEADPWLMEEGGYSADVLLGESFFKFIHAEDAAKVSAVLAKLAELNHCETEVYRLLVGGGGYVYLQTTAAFITPRRGSSKGNTILLRHSILTEVLDAGEIIDLIQMEGKRPTTNINKVDLKTFDMKNIMSSPEYDDQDSDSMSEVLEMLDKDAEELKMKKEMDMIVDLVSPLKDDNYVDLLAELPVNEPGLESSCNLQDNGFVSNRSSVIVSHKSANKANIPEQVFDQQSPLPDFTAVTDKLFVDEDVPTMTAVTEKLFMDEAPKPMTEKLFMDEAPQPMTEKLFKDDVSMPDFTAVTEDLFSSCDDSSSSEFSFDAADQPSFGLNKFKAVTEQLFTDDDNVTSSSSPVDDFSAAPAPILEKDDIKSTTIGYDDDVYPLKNIFGNLMVQDLEKLSPFIGEECISLAKGTADEEFPPLCLESFDDFDFDTACSAAPGDFRMTANTEKLFSQDDEGNDESDMSGLVSPQADIMWGGGDKDSTCSLISPRPDSGTPVSPPYRELSPRDLSPIQGAPPAKLNPVQEPVQYTPPVYSGPQQRSPQPVVMTANLLAPNLPVNLAEPRGQLFSDFIAKETVMTPRKPVPISKNVSVTVPAPPPRDNRVVSPQDFKAKLIDATGIVSADQPTSSDNNGGSSGVIVERQQQAAPASVGPRYVIVPARETGAYLTASPASISPSAQAWQSAGIHKLSFVKSVPTKQPVEPPISGVMKTQAGFPVPTRSSVLRNMMIDDPVQKWCVRGEKRMLPSDHTNTQPRHKLMRLDDTALPAAAALGSKYLTQQQQQQLGSNKMARSDSGMLRGGQDLVLLQNDGTLSVPVSPRSAAVFTI